MEDMKDMEELENIKKRSYSIIFYSRAYTNSTSARGEGKKKTAESQIKERGSALKPTSNEFMESVLKTH